MNKNNFLTNNVFLNKLINNFIYYFDHQNLITTETNIELLVI